MKQRKDTQTTRKALKYLLVTMRVAFFTFFIIAIFYLSYNIYDVFFVKVVPHQAGVFLKEVKDLTFDVSGCRIDLPFQLDYLNVSPKLQTSNPDNSEISFYNYSPVEILITENGKTVYKHVEEKPYGFLIRLTAKTVNMDIAGNLPRYRIAFCGPGGKYDPINRVAYADSVYYFDINFKLSESEPEIGIFLQDASSVWVDEGSSTKYLSINDNLNYYRDLLLTIRLIHPSETQPSLFSGMLTLDYPGENPIANPGVSINNQNTSLQRPADIVSIVSETFTFEKPFGYIEIDGNQFKLGHSVNTAFVSAPENQTVELVSDFSNPVRDYDYAITGRAIQLQADDENYIFTYWQSLSPELQNAYIGLLAAVIIGISGFLFSNWGLFVSSIKSFLFSPLLPKPALPIPLNSGMVIFYLKSGKRIAGILIRTEGFFQKQYVLLEAREWNGESWGNQINGEVKVSSDSIEMRFEN